MALLPPKRAFRDLLDIMAGCLMAAAHACFPKEGDFGFTAVRGVHAAGMEAAAGRRVERGRDVPFQQNPLLLAIRIEGGDR